MWDFVCRFEKQNICVKIIKCATASSFSNFLSVFFKNCYLIRCECYSLMEVKRVDPSPFSFFHILSLSLSLSLSHSLYHCLSITHYPSSFHLPSLVLSHTLSHSFSRPHTLSHSFSLFHFLSLSVSLLLIIKRNNHFTHFSFCQSYSCPPIYPSLNFFIISPLPFYLSIPLSFFSRSSSCLPQSLLQNIDMSPAGNFIVSILFLHLRISTCLNMLFAWDFDL